MRKYIALIRLVIFIPFFIQAQGIKNYHWQDGEELVYDVSWSFLDLGIVTLKNMGKEDIKGIETTHLQMIIESNPLLFWLDHESIYSSYIDENLQVVRFVSDENIDGQAYNGQYDFDYQNDRIELTLFDKEDPKNVHKKLFKMTPKLHDGLSLIQYARVNSLEMKTDTARTFMEDKSGDVIFNFLLSKHITKVKSLPLGINTVYFKGKINMTGLAGITGPFETWYSDDSSRVPILAFMEVFIGRVRIELQSWKRWSPKKLYTEKKNN